MGSSSLGLPGNPIDAALARAFAPKPERPDRQIVRVQIESDAEPGSGATRRRRRPESDASRPKPEPLKRVRVLAPYQVVHETVVYRPGDVAAVPSEVAEVWLLNRWATDDND